MADPTTAKKRVYEEGARNFKIAEYDPTTNTYGTLSSIEGLVDVDITFSQTTDKKAADDIPDYLMRVAPASGSGTITFIGLSTEQYKLLYNNIVDGNGVITLGDTGTPRRVGIMFDDTEGYAGGTATNRMVIYNCVFGIPSISISTTEEDSTDIRDFELDVTCSSIDVSGRKAIASIINSTENATEFTATETAMYVCASDTDISL